ncbi:c-type cytochrome [Thioclava sp. JE_KL1]|uniref:c-type cytochrome n=1 Tax=Thioclava sp. JE_KL1 TaxID=2651187 RepID=UPI00128C0349|nr:c-type cytochrome [Thioclava sp. JE_KL1]MPQ94457.1 cytochrome c [Thioclava sp. JE_KL1]
MRFTYLIAAACLAATPAIAQDGDVGKALYGQYCASCHGDDGTGAGPMAEYLNVKPADLTGLAAANDGEFPMLKAIHIIDGRTGVRAHGGPMPVFGDVFMEQGGHGAPYYTDVLATRGRVLSLATYLESLQK